jgi:antitoxin YokJ
MGVKELLEKVSTLPDCEIFPPNGLPNTDGNLELPKDVQEFYSLCGGLTLYENADYSIKIVKPDAFVLANPVIVGEQCEGDISSNWYIVASSGNSEYLTIDLGPDRLGRCYDSFFDRHGIVGESQIIALSFTELFKNLINNHGDYWYWFKDNFIYLGDAYDEIE